MKARARWRSFAIVVVAFVLVAAWKLLPSLLISSASIHYKLLVDIDDNGVLRHGEGVIGVAFQSQGPLLIGNTPQWSASAVGEAFAIDIGERGPLFVLLVGDVLRNKRNHIVWGGKGYSPDAGRQALDAYFDFSVANLPNGLGSKAKIDALGASKIGVELSPSALPLLVQFLDPRDPSTVEVVDPDNLEVPFGSGVKISHVRATIVDEPVTSGIIEERLSWLKLGYREKYLLTSPLEPRNGDVVPQAVTYGDFWSSNK